MSIFNLFDTANSGLETQREVMEIASENVANAMTPGYKARKAIISAKSDNHNFSDLLSAMKNGEEAEGISSMMLGADLGAGTQVAQIAVDQTEGYKVYMPEHPMADAEGNVEMSNVDNAEEMMVMMQAVRQYKANLTIVEMAKKAAQEAMNMTKNS